MAQLLPLPFPMSGELPTPPVTDFIRPHTGRSARAPELVDVQESFRHAQAVYDEYRATRPPQPAIEPSAAATPVNAAPAAVSSVEPAPAPVAANALIRRSWLWVTALVFAASMSSLGVAHYELRGGTPAMQAGAIDGTAFEGTIQPATTFAIAAPAGTIVRQVLVAVGDRVAEGQPLLVTDDRDAIAARDAAALEVRAAQARLDDLGAKLATIDRTPVEELVLASARLSTAEREVTQVPTRQWRDSPERAQAAYDQATLHADRLQRLFDQGLIPRQEVEDAQIAARVAQDDLANARRAAAAGTTVRTAQSEHSDVQLRVARAEREQRRLDLRGELRTAQVLREQADYRLKIADGHIRACTVTASAPGVIIELPTHAGDQVYAGAPLARLAVLDRMIAEVQVATSLVNALRPGASARVRLPGFPPVDASGTIATVNPIPNRNGNHMVTVRFDNRTGRVLAGQIAEVRFILP